MMINKEGLGTFLFMGYAWSEFIREHLIHPYAFSTNRFMDTTCNISLKAQIHTCLFFQLETF